MRKTKMMMAIVAVLAGLTGNSLKADTGVSPSLIQNGDRIVFVGDSITGQGGNIRPGGFVHLFKAGLDAVRPGNQVAVVPLGGSGQTVGSWTSVEKKSRETESFLDVKEFGVKTNLDQPANILVIMLGMNDSLSPSINPDATGFDKWQMQYRELITSLRTRIKPRVIALATITPNTEDPNSPKNQALTEMNRRLAILAKECGGIVLPTAETVWAALQKGRTCKPDFHVTSDFVHPNNVGHAAIAVGMLQGLGETSSAANLSATALEPTYIKARGALPSLSYTLVPTALPLDSDQASFELTYTWTSTNNADPSATLALPSGWTVEPVKPRGSTGTYKVSGKLDHLVNILKLSVKEAGVTKDLEIAIPAPWQLGTGFDNRTVWQMPKQDYVPNKGILPGEDRLSKGLDFGKTPEGWKGTPPKWSQYLASVAHSGGNSPGNVNFFATTFSSLFEGAYGARWIHSDKELPLKLTLGNKTFAGATGLCIWVNGEPVYAGAITSEPGKKAERDIILKKGWNSLVFKSNHLTWQWQFSIDLTASNPADLEALTFSRIMRSE